MTGAEFRTMRAKMGLTQARLGKFMGYSTRRINHIESRPRKKVRRLVELALKGLLCESTPVRHRR